MVVRVKQIILFEIKVHFSLTSDLHFDTELVFGIQQGYRECLSVVAKCY